MSIYSTLAKHFGIPVTSFWFGTGVDDITNRARRGWFYVTAEKRFYQASSFHEWQCSSFWPQKKLVGRDSL